MITHEEMLNGFQSYCDLIGDALVNDERQLAILASENLTTYLKVGSTKFIEKESE